MATQHTTNKNDRQSRSTATARRRESGQRSEQFAEEAEGYLARGNEQFRQMVEDHEGQAVLVALALGFGIGVAIGYAIGGPSERESSRWYDRAAAEGLGRKLMARIDQYLPEALSSRLHQ
jgi:hypothetical protein